MSQSLNNKVAIITGASSGIGEAAAMLLAERGAKLILAARRPEPLAVLTQRIREAGGEAVCATTDVRSQTDMSNLVELACTHYGRLDTFINNAGVMPISPLDDLRIADWEAMVDVNIKGVLYGIAAALPVFRRQQSGHFINIASTAGHKTVPNQAVYSGTKFAVRAISEGMRQEAGAQLRVMIISPGITRTNFADGITDPEIRSRLVDVRDVLAMPPEAVARSIAFAMEQPDDVDINEIIIRPTAQA
ncbi:MULTISPECIES: SDR family oxidoreductase [Paenibacillus]|uniref:SDR family oxidoreductase n=1 Tax=Paenibacillus TaxID=44249 RepID=UPI00036D0147|nr:MULTISPECIES: SDR family oxidoreductase [Paenibacillus]